MEASSFIAKFLGLYCAIVAVALFVNKQRFQTLLLEMKENAGVVILSGVMALMFGLLIVLFHPIWTGWPILITVIGYLSILKGVVRLCFTQWVGNYIASFAKDSKYYFMSVLTLVLGLVLLYFGYMI